MPRSSLHQKVYHGESHIQLSHPEKPKHIKPPSRHSQKLINGIIGWVCLTAGTSHTICADELTSLTFNGRRVR